MLYERFLNSVAITSVDYEALINTLRHISIHLKNQYREVKDVSLFGSFARGDYTPDSDVDILIICEHTDIPFLLRADQYIRRFSHIPFDINIIVYTQEEIDRLRKEKNPFLLQVDKEAHSLLKES